MKDQLYSRANEVTNPFDFWFKKTFSFLNLQFNFVKPNEFSNFTDNIDSVDQIFSPKRLQHYSYENFYAQHVLHTNKHYFFVNNEFSSPSHLPPNTGLTHPTCMDPFKIMTPLKITLFIFLNIILTDHSLSHEEPFLLMSLIYMFFTTNHHLHYQHKTTHFSIPYTLSQFHLQHFIFITTFSPLYTLHLNCTK